MGCLAGWLLPCCRSWLCEEEKDDWGRDATSKPQAVKNLESSLLRAPESRLRVASLSPPFEHALRGKLRDRIKRDWFAIDDADVSRVKVSE